MSDNEILTALKIDLHISTTAYDSFLQGLIQSSKTYIHTEGINLRSDSVADGNLVRMYASYLYRSRDNDTGMPRALRYALNNRLWQEVAHNG